MSPIRSPVNIASHSAQIRCIGLQCPVPLRDSCLALEDYAVGQCLGKGYKSSVFEAIHKATRTTVRTNRKPVMMILLFMPKGLVKGRLLKRQPVVVFPCGGSLSRTHKSAACNDS